MGQNGLDSGSACENLGMNDLVICLAISQEVGSSGDGVSLDFAPKLPTLRDSLATLSQLKSLPVPVSHEHQVVV